MNINLLISRIKRYKNYHSLKTELVKVLFFKEKLKEMNYVPKPGNADLWEFYRNVNELCPGIGASLFETRFSNVWFENKWRGVRVRFYVYGVRVRWFPLTNNWNFDVEDVVRQMQNINDLIPEWNKEFNVICDTLQHELQKYDKTKQIGINTVVVLAKNRMREFGLEYQLNARLLEVRLRHGRKLVVTLPADNPALAQKWLGRIPQSVAAINSVPSRYRVESRHRANTTVTRKEDAERFTFVTSVEEIIVSLPKGRELALKQSLTMAQFEQPIDEIPRYEAAINSVPRYFRIRKALSSDKWKNGRVVADR